MLDFSPAVATFPFILCTLTEAELKKRYELLNFKGQPVYAAMEFFRGNIMHALDDLDNPNNHPITEYSIQTMLERYKLPRFFMLSEPGVEGKKELKRKACVMLRFKVQCENEWS
ncbi:hypothetical protein E3N88_16039 [Mikania micrantha]|uniref:Uncharacterized protein n=1 Tax=Mikania micrantha TaxID=192012 RepID=A0A5N6NXC0_9ASTR|nr:hypothetical protein E3N88_16039 [Mikania micrantha]